MKITRSIDPAAYKRAQKLSNEEAVRYLDNSVMALGQSFDTWRGSSSLDAATGNAAEEVRMCVDAIVALWTELENRGLTNDR